MRVFLDHNSTTPVDDRVLTRMVPFFGVAFGNPSSAHSFGAEAAKAIEKARTAVSALVNAEPDQVTFCASATESINTVIAGIQRGTIVSSAVEHAATLESLDRARSRGVSVTLLGVDAHGILDLNELRTTLERGAALVTLLWANNETGVLFPIESVAEICAAYAVPLHVDAVQAAGKLSINFGRHQIRYLSISSHKLFGPKGAAALISKDRLSLQPLIVGGGQERGQRAGTENVPAIVGFGAAAEFALEELGSRMDVVKRLRDRLEDTLLERCPSLWVNGRSSPRIANTSSVSFPGVDGDDLVSTLDALGIAAATGSACHSNSTEPSHVIRAMTGSYEKARQTVRFSVSHMNTRDEVDFAANSIIRATEMLRSSA